MKLAFQQRGMAEGDDDILGWTRDDGAFVLEVRGSEPTTIEPQPGDVFEVAIEQHNGGETTTLFLLRDGRRTRLATGGIGMTADGIHGPTLATQLEACGCDVRVSRS
jgi:hypothetical protein